MKDTVLINVNFIQNPGFYFVKKGDKNDSLINTYSLDLLHYR